MADEDTFETTIAGRTMLFKKSSEGQLIALQRVLNRLRTQFSTAEDPVVRREAATKLGATVLDVAESRFVDPADRDWVEEQMLLGLVDIPEVMKIFSNGAVREEPQPDDAPPPAKKTAAKRSPKAAPAKKTANASRARR
jgi:hypothetical protein